MVGIVLTIELVRARHDAEAQSSQGSVAVGLVPNNGLMATIQTQLTIDALRKVVKRLPYPIEVMLMLIVQSAFRTTDGGAGARDGTATSGAERAVRAGAHRRRGGARAGATPCRPAVAAAREVCRRRACLAELKQQTNWHFDEQGMACLREAMDYYRRDTCR